MNEVVHATADGCIGVNPPLSLVLSFKGSDGDGRKGDGIDGSVDGGEREKGKPRRIPRYRDN